MKVHHLNCGCMCPVGGAIFDGFSKGIYAHLVCHCLLIETGVRLENGKYPTLSLFFVQTDINCA